MLNSLDNRFNGKNCEILDATGIFDPQSKIATNCKNWDEYGIIERDKLLKFFGIKKMCKDAKTSLLKNNINNINNKKKNKCKIITIKPIIMKKNVKNEWITFIKHFKIAVKHGQTRNEYWESEWKILYSTGDHLFPEICKLSLISQMIPKATVLCENGFSTLSHIKSKKRNSTEVERCDQFMRVFFQGPDTLEQFRDDVFPDAFEIFWNMKKRHNISEIGSVDFHDLRHRTMHQSILDKKMTKKDIRDFGYILGKALGHESDSSDNNDDSSDSSDSSDDSDNSATSSNGADTSSDEEEDNDIEVTQTNREPTPEPEIQLTFCDICCVCNCHHTGYRPFKK